MSRKGKERKRAAKRRKKAEQERRRGCPRCEYTRIVKGICPGTTQCLGCFRVVTGPQECIGCEVEFASKRDRLDRGCPLCRKGT